MLGISVSKTELIFDSIRNLGYDATRTHIESRAIKSDIPIEKLKEILMNFHNKQNTFSK
jgi:tRNA G26 N,N-dimethylase Trm1